MRLYKVLTNPGKSVHHVVRESGCLTTELESRLTSLLRDIPDCDLEAICQEMEQR